MDKLLELFEQSKIDNAIPNEYYSKYNVKKGLRNDNGTGVLIGLTRIADVVGYQKDENDNKIDCEGQLYYRGYEISELIKYLDDGSLGMYEKVCFLILFGHLPNEKELALFNEKLNNEKNLPEGFMVTNILRQPSINVMNKIQRALLMLYSEDETADDASSENTLKQGLSILAKMAAIMVYAYQAKAHIINNDSLVIHPIQQELTIAENILSLLRKDQQYSLQEAKILDLLLVLHADHGSGNNSTFTNIVVASTGTDIYSAMSASVGSLKGPKHGGANITCRKMMKTIIDDIGLDADETKIKDVIHKLLDKQYYDHSGLVYGFGHAVYTLSDPRCVLLKKQAVELAKEKGKSEEYSFYERFEKCVKEIFKQERDKNICANIDFYSGFVYEMMDIPEDLFTPLFVSSRIIGWLAHNIEEKCYSDRIFRPAGLYVGEKEHLL